MEVFFLVCVYTWILLCSLTHDIIAITTRIRRAAPSDPTTPLPVINDCSILLPNRLVCSLGRKPVSALLSYRSIPIICLHMDNSGMWSVFIFISHRQKDWNRMMGWRKMGSSIQQSGCFPLLVFCFNCFLSCVYSIL